MIKVQLKRLILEEIKEIYKNNVGGKCKKYGKDIPHYCYIPLLIEKEEGNVISCCWFFIERMNEIVFIPSKNHYVNLEAYEEKRSRISNNIYLLNNVVEVYVGNYFKEKNRR